MRAPLRRQRPSSRVAQAPRARQPALGSASAGPSGAASGQAAAASKFVAPYLATPTKITVTTPLKTRPPKNKLIIFLESNLPQGATEQIAMAQAAAAAGWKEKAIPYQSDNRRP